LADQAPGIKGGITAETRKEIIHVAAFIAAQVGVIVANMTSDGTDIYEITRKLAQVEKDDGHERQQ